MSKIWILLYVSTLRFNGAFSGQCSTRNIDIANGDYSIRAGNSVVEFTCNSGFILYGESLIVCFGYSWSADPPICIAPTCEQINPTSVLRVTSSLGGSVLTFGCAVDHRLVGAGSVICDGTNWSAEQPTCEPWTPPTQCDFEQGPDPCGWGQGTGDDQDWVLNTGSTPTSRTGPDHDHTLGQDGKGYYMYFETSSPTRESHAAVLESPIYSVDMSNLCFSFWYHILGEKEIGTLEVIIKPDDHDGLTGLEPAFSVSQNLGTEWQDHTIEIPEQKGPFQIVFRATRSKSYRSDFAVDDVSLETCPGSATTTTTTTKKRTTATKLPTTTPTTTTIAPTTTTAATTTSTSTTTPTTISPTQSTTIKITKQTVPKTSPTDITKEVATTANTRIETNKPNEPTQQMNKTSTSKGNIKENNSKSSLSAKEDRNPPQAPGKGLAPVAIVFVALSCLLVIGGVAVGVGIWFHRRRVNRSLDYRASLPATNPLYDIDQQERLEAGEGEGEDE
ncbi:MAM and LDL-receptor class A domain-containing protein 2-like [Mya arenaria]|uniref:MAM and LDL-receptor class A domain-containing protein 2-like n=1 Tax=Mya arenaria TaxID=6604 RepID=UPI0022E14A6A|nr:MAM and LDL-receptor class A domain-containing protein 2-like [Mya arenaria]